MCFLEVAVEVFYHAIGLGLIGRSLLMLHTQQGTQSSPQLEGQLDSPVGSGQLGPPKKGR
jgi:hypothetical protein